MASGIEAPLIKGSVIRDARAWMVSRLDEDVWKDGVAGLTGEDRDLYSRAILAASWYKLATWNAVLARARQGAKTRFQLDEADFDRRNIAEAGSATLRTVYKFMLGFSSPESTLKRVPTFFASLFRGPGRFEAKIERGRGVVGCYDAHPEIVDNCSHHYIPGCRLLLDLNGGAREVRWKVLRLERAPSAGCFEFEITYDSL